MISLAEGRQLILDKLAPLQTEICGLEEAQGRELRSALLAPEDFPASDRATMDGYAVNAQDESAHFRVIGEVQTGTAPALRLRRGECVRIFTGASLPEGASEVIRQEDVRREGAMMISVVRSRERYIRRQGEEARPGDVLLSAGTVLGAGELSLLAQAGKVRVETTRPVRVIHLATGEELVSPDLAPGPAQIRDSNSILMAALLREQGAVLVRQLRCGDDPGRLRGLIESVSESWDLLLISGGASVGDYDFGQRVLTDLGFETVFAGLHLKPGKPLVFARREQQAAFVIPGNPVSHFVTWHVAMRVAVERLSGKPSAWPLVRASLTAPVAALRDARETFWPARVQFAGEVSARLLRQQSSGDLGALVGANALMRFAAPTTALPAGTQVEVLLLRS